MENKFKQYAIISSNWVPNNPIRAFMPFIYDYILTKKPSLKKLEDISVDIDELYGLHLTYSLLRTILEYLKNNGEASLNNGVWSFNIREKNRKPIANDIDDSEINEFINNFIEYIGGGIKKEEAERLINSFFARYDYEVLKGQATLNDCHFDNYDYFVAEYIKNLFKLNSSSLSFLFKIAQGSIIKSAISSENLELTIFSNKCFYFDTKILFRLLGYYGDYYQKEYEALFLELRQQKANLRITEYVYYEALSILRGCEKYIDSAEYQYEKASDVLRYFRSIKISKESIQEKINTFEDVLKDRYGIIIDKTDIYKSQDKKYNEDYQGLKALIVDKYGYSNNEFTYVYDNSVETDLKSILHAYLARGNNDVVLIKDSPLFFITTNGALVKSVMEYHLEKYGKKLSPIMSDTFLGVLLYTNTNKLEEYSKLKLLAFCHEAYKPTKEQREKFIECVEKANNENRLTDDQTFLLKHYSLIDDVLVTQLRENDFNINDDCVYDTLEEIHKDLVKDISDSYKREIAATKEVYEATIANNNAKHQEDLLKQQKKYSQELNETKSNFETLLKNKEDENIQFRRTQFDKDLNKYKHRVTAIFYSVSFVVLVAAIFVLCIPLIFNTDSGAWYTVAYRISTAVVAVIDVIQIIRGIIKKEVCKKAIEKKTKKLLQNYGLSNDPLI